MSELLFRVPRSAIGLFAELFRDYQPGDHWKLAVGDVEPRVLDIGANVGGFSLLVSQMWNGACEVHAYEPHPETLRLLRANMVDLPVQIHACAVVGDGYEGTHETLFDGQSNSLGASLYKLGWQGDRSYRVRAMQAGNLPPASVIKCDTEGCEVEILSSYKHGAGVRLALVEWHREEDASRLEGILAGWGLSLCHSNPGQNGTGTMSWSRRT